jgi:hypothetical protein
LAWPQKHQTAATSKFVVNSKHLRIFMPRDYGHEDLRGESSHEKVHGAHCCGRDNIPMHNTEELAHIANAMNVREAWLQRAMAEVAAEAAAEDEAVCAIAEVAAAALAHLTDTVFGNVGLLSHVLSFCDAPILVMCGAMERVRGQRCSLAAALPFAACRQGHALSDR